MAPTEALERRVYGLPPQRVDRDITEEIVDDILLRLDRSAREVTTAHGSAVRLPAMELNMLVVLAEVRDVMNASLSGEQRQQLIDIWGGTCVRTARVRAIQESVKLSVGYASDQRMSTTLAACEAVEQVLQDIGLSRELDKAKADEKEVLAMELELAADLGGDGFEDGDCRTDDPEGVPPLTTLAPGTAATGSTVLEGSPPSKAAEMSASSASPVRLPIKETRPLCHSMYVPLCRIGCGRPVAPGVTRHGMPFDTCCRACAMGKGHNELCCSVHIGNVGSGMCKMGCGRKAAKGTASSGQVLDTCCRGCAWGEGHDELCETDVGEAPVSYMVIDSSSFFQQARKKLSLVQYNELLHNIWLLNRHQLTPEECLEKVRDLLVPLGEEGLHADLEQLLARKNRGPGAPSFGVI